MSKQSEDRDWRLTGHPDKQLVGLRFCHRTWAPSNSIVFSADGKSAEIVENGWGHDHCWLCWAEISNDDTAFQLLSSPQNWVCENCYADFNGRFNWSAAEEQ